MRPIEKYLDDVKRKAGLPTDKALADRLGIKHPSICRIRSGEQTPSDETCARLAALAGDPVEKVLLLAAESRAPKSTRKAWHNILKRMVKSGAFTLMLLVGLTWATPATSFAESRSMDVMLHFRFWAVRCGGGGRASLSPRVVLFVQQPEPLRPHVGIYLRGGDIGVPEHLLDGPQVGAPFEQVCGE